MKIHLALLINILLLGCTFSGKDQPNILILLSEKEPKLSQTCSDETSEEAVTGVKLLCKEAVRFTQAYSVSTMSQPNVATLLTGKYPFEHGVWHNGPLAISAKNNTIAEVAHNKGLRTSFFSGGGAIWRKAGFQQGFEVFDDRVEITKSKLYSPAQEIAASFISWLGKEVKQSPFLSVLYFSDGMFSEKVGNGKNKKNSSSKTDEAIQNVFQYLRNTNRWNNTIIIYASLSNRDDEFTRKGLRVHNLQAESTQIPLLIKPKSVKRDEAMRWELNKNVSLVDVAKTVFDILGDETSASTNKDFEAVSLKPLLQNPEWPYAVGRPLLIESAWYDWRFAGKPEYAIRIEQYLIINDKKMRVYNSLVDQQELVALDESEISQSMQVQKAKQLFSKYEMEPFEEVPKSVEEKYTLARRFWTKNISKSVNEELIQTIEFYKNDPEYTEWFFARALAAGDWPTVETVSKKNGKVDLRNIALMNLGKKYDVNQFEDPCLRMLYGLPEKLIKTGLRSSQNKKSKVCNDNIFLNYINSMKSSEEELSIKDKLIKYWTKKDLAHAVAAISLVNENVFDVDSKLKIESDSAYLLKYLTDQSRIKKWFPSKK